MRDRIEALMLARLTTARKPLSDSELAAALHRFAPSTKSDTAWTEHVVNIRAGLSPTATLTDHIGAHDRRTWAQYCDRIFPAMALEVRVSDAKAHARLTDRDAWAAAIAGRTLGIWTEGPPPSAAAICDAFAWRELALPGKPKRCPPEIRALFLQRSLATDPGPFDRMLRLFAAKAVEAPRTDLRALRDALVRGWLLGRVLGPRTASFAEDVRSLAATTRTGVFGDRKVFIASVWDELRRHPTWSSLSLDDFKSRLVRAHKAGDLVLARADLVAAMNPALVAASETSADGASFHFIVREPS